MISRASFGISAMAVGFWFSVVFGAIFRLHEWFKDEPAPDGYYLWAILLYALPLGILFFVCICGCVCRWNKSGSLALVAAAFLIVSAAPIVSGRVLGFGYAHDLSHKLIEPFAECGSIAGAVIVYGAWFFAAFYLVFSGVQALKGRIITNKSDHSMIHRAGES